MPADVTGSSIYNQQRSDFEFRPGPIFANLLLADEINRAPPKTQAALLEAMQERQVTIEGTTHVLAAAVRRARHAEPDRVRGHLPAARGPARPFRAADGRRLSLSRDTSGRCCERRLERAEEEVELDAVVERHDAASRCSARSNRSTWRRASASTSSISSPRRELRPASRSGASPRGSLALLKLARGRAALSGRDYVDA